MRKKLFGLAGTLSAFALVLSAGIATTLVSHAEGETPVKYSADATLWETKTGVAFDETKQDMYLTDATSFAGTSAFGGNSTIEFTSVGNTNDTWGYNWIVFKNTGDSTVTWKADHIDTTSSGTGNWLALVYGGSSNSYIAECEDGVITKTKTNWSGNDTWHPAASTTTISITTTDTADGVTAELSFTAEGYDTNTGTANTFTYSSDNKALWGEQRATFGTWTGSAISADATIRYDIDITDVSSDQSAVVDKGIDFSGDESKWETKTNVAFDSEKKTFYPTGNFVASTTPVGGNSTVYVTSTPDADVSYTWGFGWVMVKNSGSTTSLLNPNEAVNTQTDGTNNWIGIVYGKSTQPYIAECNNGVITKIDLEKTASWSYAHTGAYFDNIFDIKIETEDTATGVTVKVTFDTAQGVYSYTHTSTNTALWGQQRVTVGHWGDAALSADSTAQYKVSIKDIASEYPPEEGGEGEGGGTTDPVDPPVVTGGNYSSDASKWETKTGVAFDEVNKDMYLTAASSVAGTQPIGGNSTISFKSTPDSGYDQSWSYNWIVFKDSGAAASTWKADNLSVESSGTGNWIALVYGKSSYPYLAECVDGVITKIGLHDSGLNYDTVTSKPALAYDITIKTTDTEEGVKVEITFAADPLETPFMYTYNSTNKAIWGAQRITIGTTMGTAISADKTLRYDVDITDVASDKVAVVDKGTDFSGDESKWETKTNIAFDSEKKTVYPTNKDFTASTTPVGGNSTIYVTSTPDASLTYAWGFGWVIFKSDSATTVRPAEHTVAQTDGTNNWIGIVYGISCVPYLAECNNGVITKIALNDGEKFGADAWNMNHTAAYATKKFDIKIVTEDTATGVVVKITFDTAQGIYTYEHTSTNKALWGQQRVVVGHWGDAGFVEGSTIHHNVIIKDVASDYTKDMYYVGEVSAKIAALATEITDDNYTAAKEAYTAAKAAYDGLTDAQKAIVTTEEVEKLTAVATAIATYEEVQGVAKVKEGIENLPEEITLANYADAKAAIELVNTMYGALTETQKAEITADEKTALDNAVAALTAFEALKAEADVVAEKLNGLPADTIYRDTYTAAKAAVTAAEEAYNALSDGAKALIDADTYGKLATAKEYLETYETDMYQPVEDASNLAQKQSNWTSNGSVNTANVTYGINGMTIGNAGAATAVLLDKNIAADSKIELTVDANANAITSWGQNLIVFKNMSKTVPDAAAVLTAVDHGGVTGAPAGTWMGLMFGNSSGLVFSYCVDGALTTVDLGKSAPNVPSTEYNSAIKQITHITIQTKDTATGVEVTITYKAEGISSITGETYTYTTTVENTAFIGDYAFSVGAYYGCVTTNVGENITIRNLKVTNENGPALVNRVVDDGMANHATSADYWKDIQGYAGLEFSENGIELWDVKTASFVLNRKIEDKQTVYFEIDGTLEQKEGTYGNMYFILKHDRPTSVYNGGVEAAAEGNYIALMIGGDGFKIVECIDGEVQEPVALKDPGSAGDEQKGSNLDVWYWYSQYTKVAITTEEVNEDDEQGVKVTIELIGGNSNAKTVRTYFSENTKLFGNGYTGIEFFNYSAATETGLVTLASVKVAGVAEGFVPDVDVAAVNADLATKAGATITAENLAEYTEYYEEALAIYETLNYEQIKAFNMANVETLKAKLDAYPENVAAAEAVEALITALPTTITADTYEAAKTAIEAAEAAYNALSAEAKAMVANAEALTAARELLDANVPVKPDDSSSSTEEESSSTESESTTPDSSTTSGDTSASTSDKTEEAGCFGSVTGVAAMAGITMLAGAAVVATRKKED